MIQNPILKGFCPDPSIIRVGGDYYIATSTFEWWPGVKLFHSRDLKQWEQIPSPLRRASQLNMLGNPPSGGIWAPCLSYDGQYYYLVYTDVKTKKGRYYNTHNYLVYTDDIYGEWSEPLYLNSIGFDPSLFHDTDGKKYLVNMVNGFKGVLVQELAWEKKSGKQAENNKESDFKEEKEIQKENRKNVNVVDEGKNSKQNVENIFCAECPPPFCLAGERKKIYGGSGIGCTEGPHLYHIGDWYYLLVAEGGTGYEHCVTVARAKSVWGPFETDPENPVLTSDRENPSALQKCGHADLVETPEGEWYVVHLCSRPLNGQKWCTLGRETAIQKVYWKEDGWLRLSGGGKFARNIVPEIGEGEETFEEGMQEKESGQDIKQMGEKPLNIHDDFDTPELPLYYSSPRVSCESFADLTARPGYLRLRGQESLNSLHHVSLLAIRQQEICVTVQTCMEFTPDYPEQAAGLAYMYDAMNFYLLVKTADENGQSILTLLKSDAGVITDEMEPIPIAREGRLELRAVLSQDGCTVQFYFREMCQAEQLGNEAKQEGQQIGQPENEEKGEECLAGQWHPAGESLSTQLVTDEHCRGFTGAHFGMYVHDMTGLSYHADFDYFTYFHGKEA